ncbi:hypothetical protein OSTOST_09896 [Ostertagia ostertagi]
MTDVVPEVEEFGHDVPMDPTMEPEDSEHSEELDSKLVNGEATVTTTFDWDAYLREQNAEPAPPECFYQPDTPPENKANGFKRDVLSDCGERLQIVVVCTFGRPTVEDHMKLNPPIGFIHHHGTFPKFLEQHLKPDDETGASVLCPPEWFKPVSGYMNLS